MAIPVAARKQFRKEVLSLISNVMLVFDGSGKSGDYWDNYFKSYSDEAFVREIERFLSNPKLFFTPEVIPFDKSRQPTFDSYAKLASMLNIELEEYVVLPYMKDHTSLQSSPVTATRVPVGPIHLKRLQQFIQKKNKLTLTAESRDLRHGQVRGDDKGGRITDQDAYSLSIIGAEPVLQELYGPRADSADTKEALYKAISEGERLPRMSEMPHELANKTALNTLNAYILGASLMSDVVSKTYLLPVVANDIISDTGGTLAEKYKNQGRITN
jgi:hypothetical protein